ncbi:MAG: galactose mutarotase [Clostridia bacterium]|nr:galactose mutarotase [Clostridia bacterium]
MAITERFFGKIDGKEIYEYTLSRGAIEVGVINYGGIIRTFNVKTDKDVIDIVLGYNSLDEYLRDESTYFGSIVGRVANRIAGGKFTLNGKEYSLYLNNGVNCLHGGKVGFNRKIWKAEITGDYSLRLSYCSADGEENFPAALKVCAEYSLTEKKGLKIEYVAETDGDTPVNLTNHSYFNLNGAGSGNVLKHVLTLYADRITPVNENMTPMGAIMPVVGTPFDFRIPKEIGKDIGDNNEQLSICGGYDVNYVKNAEGYGLIAKATGDKSGIEMSVYTSERGVQFYSGNFLNGIKGKGGIYCKRCGFCLETQGFPNAVNCKEYPSIVLKAGQKYESCTEYVIKP